LNNEIVSKKRNFTSIHLTPMQPKTSPKFSLTGSKHPAGIDAAIAKAKGML